MTPRKFWPDPYSDEETLLRQRMQEIELAEVIEREQYPVSWAWRIKAE